jgi:hypothetical protein
MIAPPNRCVGTVSRRACAEHRRQSRCLALRRQLEGTVAAIEARRDDFSLSAGVAGQMREE